MILQPASSEELAFPTCCPAHAAWHDRPSIPWAHHEEHVAGTKLCTGMLFKSMMVPHTVGCHHCCLTCAPGDVRCRAIAAAEEEFQAIAVLGGGCCERCSSRAASAPKWGSVACPVPIALPARLLTSSCGHWKLHRKSSVQTAAVRRQAPREHHMGELRSSCTGRRLHSLTAEGPGREES